MVFLRYFLAFCGLKFHTISTRSTRIGFFDMSRSIYQTKGGWRADVCVDGRRRTKKFARKQDASIWATACERDLLLDMQSRDALDRRNIVVTMSEALRRYAAEKSILKKTAKKEQQRIVYLMNHLPNVHLPLASYHDGYLTAYKDAVMQRSVNPLSASSVLRDFSILNAVFNWAWRDKKWIDHNPLHSVKKPKKPTHRERRISEDEINRILSALQYDKLSVPQLKIQQVGLIFLIALATGMRSGEIVQRRLSDVCLHKNYVLLPDTKNGTSRIVPLDDYAKLLWSLALQIDRPAHVDRVFTVSCTSRDVLFRKAKKAAGLDGVDLRFHDSRHEAASLMAKRLSNPLTLCKVFGWKDPRFALVYYNPTNDEIVAELNAKKLG